MANLKPARLFTWYFFLRGFVLLFLVSSMSQLEGLPRTPYTGLNSSFFSGLFSVLYPLPPLSVLERWSASFSLSFTYYRVSLSVKVLPCSFYSTSWGVGEFSFLSTMHRCSTGLCLTSDVSATSNGEEARCRFYNRKLFLFMCPIISSGLLSSAWMSLLWKLLKHFCCYIF